MRARPGLIGAPLAAALALAALPAAAQAASTYCSPTGDYCQASFRRR